MSHGDLKEEVCQEICLADSYRASQTGFGSIHENAFTMSSYNPIHSLSSPG